MRDGAEMCQMGSGVDHKTDSVEYSSKEKNIRVKARWKAVEESSVTHEREGRLGRLEVFPSLQLSRTMPWS